MFALLYRLFNDPIWLLFLLFLFALTWAWIGTGSTPPSRSRPSSSFPTSRTEQSGEASRSMT
jgi:hypothetical protein